MTSCNYRLLNDIYNAIVELSDISTKLEDLDLSFKIDELDIDLDNLERQLVISNKLKFLELVGTDIMPEEQQISTYNDIKEELFAPSAGFAEEMQVEEGD
jgi:hypothetical protein